MIALWSDQLGHDEDNGCNDEGKKNKPYEAAAQELENRETQKDGDDNDGDSHKIHDSIVTDSASDLIQPSPRALSGG